jgi:transposase InsO family protein
VPWLWGEKQIEAFKTLKDYLVSKPILALYDQNLETRLYTDASAIGIAGILVQVRDNRENVVAYFSRHTTLNEHKYHSFELETLAIVSSVKRFRQYLLGRPFTIITDCAAVRATFSKSEVNPRVGRWVLELNEYNFTIIHRGNQQMRHVDALSRNPPTPEPAVHVVTISEEDWLLAAQQGDKELHRVREILESGEWEDNKNIFRDYALKGGKVCKITNYGLRWVVPKAAKFQILRMAHDDAGHFAFDKTYELISRQYWFPRMRRFIKKYIDNCLHCIYFKTPAGKPQGSLHPIPKIAVPFHTVHIDHVGPFVKSRQGNTEVLVAVDAFTKFVLLYPVKTTRAKHVVRALKDLTKNFGAPHRIISDGAKSFVGKVFTNFCRKRKIHHYVNAPSVPRANGQVERYNRTLLSALATMGADVDDDQWDENIDNIQLGMNGTINRAIGVTPSEALMGIRVSANRMLEPGVDPVVDVTKVREAIAEKTTSYQAAQKLQFDSKRALSRSYSEGDLVMTKIVSHPATGQSKKLLPKWRGPFRITEVLPNERYRVEDIPGARRTKFRYRGVAAVDNLRPWVVFA